MEYKNCPLTPSAKEFVFKFFPCIPPCTAYGLCINCCERIAFQTGYNLGFRAEGMMKAFFDVLQKYSRSVMPQMADEVLEKYKDLTKLFS